MSTTKPSLEEANKWMHERANQIAGDSIERTQIIAAMQEAVGRFAHAAVILEPLSKARASDAEDAARYRWLRNLLPGSAYRIAGVIYSEGGAGVDAAIDAVRAAQGDADSKRLIDKEAGKP